MIARSDLESLAGRPAGQRPVLSIFLDTSVDSNQKRHHEGFLSRKQAEFLDNGNDRTAGFRQALTDAFARAAEWLRSGYHPDSRGVAFYVEVGGPWSAEYQFPIPLGNRIGLGDRPLLGPLAQVLRSYDHHGIVVVDREHARILSVYLGSLLEEVALAARKLPPRNHQHQHSAFAEQRYQRRKLEETRQAMEGFAAEIEAFVKTHQPRDLSILGTPENVARLRAALPPALDAMVIHTGSAPSGESTSRIIEAIQPVLRSQEEEHERELVDLLVQRLSVGHLATSGMQNTLAALQAGRVETLILSTNTDATGSRCTRCGFIFGPGVNACPYDGAPTDSGLPLIEELMRAAESSHADVRFVPSDGLADLPGVGALLRF
jgi:peptide subunit release factor 1 (eRF1)